MPRITHIDWGSGESRTVIFVIPKQDDLDLSKDIDAMRKRIADNLNIPKELIDPKNIRICDHPAFDNGATIRKLTARGTIPKKPTE